MGEVETIVEVAVEVDRSWCIGLVCHALLTTVNILEYFLSFIVVFNSDCVTIIYNLLDA